MVKPIRFGSKQWLIIIIGCVAAIILAVVGILSNRTAYQRQTSLAETTAHTDPVTGQEYVVQTGIAPEKLSQSATLFSGFGALLDSGLTQEQISGIEAALLQYHPFAENVLIDLAANDIQPISPEATDPLFRWSIRSTIVVNHDLTYKLRAYYWNGNEVEVFLYDAKSQLFDSGTIVGTS